MLDAVQSGQTKPPMRRAPLGERDADRRLRERDCCAVLITRNPDLGPLRNRKLTGLSETTPENRFRRLVVEDHGAAGIGDEQGRGEVLGEIPREDQRKALVRGAIHCQEGTGLTPK